MSLVGFDFYEKLGHLIDDSAEKEKDRVEIDAIRDRQTHIYQTKCSYYKHTCKYYKIFFLYVKNM